MKVRHLILDRDGVLNVEGPSGWVTHPDDWAWQRGALGALRRLCIDRRVSVATNQSCIGRGLVDAEDVRAVHERMRTAARAAGARIDAVWLCPHAPTDGCTCRKPQPGLLLEAIRESGIPAAETLFVGDSTTDLEAGRRAGVAIVLVRTGKGEASASTMAADGVLVLDDLDALADLLASGAEAPLLGGSEQDSAPDPGEF